MIYYVTGGERSGRSNFAQNLALSLSENPVYLATARKWDENFQERINKHQQERDERWENVEEEKYLGKLDLEKRVVVMDCVTLWLTNWYVDLENNIEACQIHGKQELEQLFDKECTLIIISNEIGMGLHAQNEVGRKFTELQAWMNQFIAQKADKATFMVSGLPVTLK